jgi:hypothetical protein
MTDRSPAQAGRGRESLKVSRPQQERRPPCLTGLKCNRGRSANRSASELVRPQRACR